ncbi:hypothetical protein AVENP_3103 [Arcobacter venerupis]|uniref:Uncharacterized protein n=1 Tax=Arcobacter venerupis TaxID=1054033 RepID=A0AAE7BB61_9BACT|nr:hypothetical protein [Arcobacter venerupis]QKF68566.1 hypothetical protein AVENP_3103 [Arcobacter venerupis]RWS48737.1 hypothetical protein CKA56_12835 [Arcobacter venerupis]
MRLENRNDILYLDKIKFKSIKDNIVDDDCEKMVEIETTEELEILLNLNENDILNNILFDGLLNDIGYHFYKKEQCIIFKLFKVLPVEDWNYSISPKEYCKLFKFYFADCDPIYEEGNIFVEVVYFVDKNERLKDTEIFFLNEIGNIHKKIFQHCNINKNIEFPPEHLTAGISILQYFGKLLQEKYPNEKVSVSIKQEGLRVTMIIETPDGKKEEIEEYLNRYGMVITNQITPQEFTSNPIQLIELKQELREAQNKILFQQELLSLKDDTYKNRIISLEDEVNFLRKEFSEALLTNKENIEILLSSLLTKDKLIKRLTKSIEKRDITETKQLLLELKKEDSKGYVSLKEHIDNIIVGNLTNTSAWLEFLITHFSK